MSRARHKMHKAMGGGVKPVWNAGGEQNAAKEAEEKKKGGRVHGEGEKSKHRADRRARGGKVHHREGSAYEEAHESAAERKREAVDGRRHGGRVDGHPKHHADGGKAHHEHMHSEAAKRNTGGAVPGRKRGGGIGADRMPLSSAAKIKEITPGEVGEDAEKD